MNNCDGCTECCDMIPIDTVKFEKPEGVLCPFCTKGVGCNIYSTRPEVCREFPCLYRLSDLDESLRPDKTHVIFEMLYTKIYLALVNRENLDSWKTELMMEYINKLNAAGISVVASSFMNGVIEVFTAPKHEKDKVLELARKVAI